MAHDDMNHNLENTMPTGNGDGDGQVDEMMDNTQGRPTSADNSALASEDLDSGTSDRSDAFGETIDKDTQTGSEAAPDGESAQMNRDEQDDALKTTGQFDSDTGEIPGEGGRTETFGERIGAPASNSGGPANPTETEDAQDDDSRSLTERIRDKMDELAGNNDNSR